MDVHAPSAMRWLAASALLLFPALAAAQSGRVRTVEVSGSKAFPGAAIAAMSGLQPGERVTRETIQAAADRLAQLGPFLKVAYRFQSRGEDVEIEFQVEDAPRVPVSYDNFAWFTDGELHHALQEAIPFFDGTAPEQGTLLDLMSGALAKLVASRGVTGEVERELVGRPDGPGLRMQFRVRGPALRVEAVEFSDAVASEDKRVRERLVDLVDKPYSRLAVEVFLQEQVRPVYLERGHLGVRFLTPEARLGAPPKRAEAGAVVVMVRVEPGPVYAWGGAEWIGAVAFGAAALNGYLGLVLDERANGIKIAAAFDRVRDEYGRRGYLDASVEPEAVYDPPAGRVRYRVRVVEGPPYRMGQLIVTGLSLAAERRLLAAWRIPAGEVFDRLYFEDFLNQGIKIAFGDLPVPSGEIGRWLRTNAEARTVDVLLDFK